MLYRMPVLNLSQEQEYLKTQRRSCMNYSDYQSKGSASKFCASAYTVYYSVVVVKKSKVK